MDLCTFFFLKGTEMSRWSRDSRSKLRQRLQQQEKAPGAGTATGPVTGMGTPVMGNGSRHPPSAPRVPHTCTTLLFSCRAKRGRWRTASGAGSTVLSARLSRASEGRKTRREHRDKRKGKGGGSNGGQRVRATVSRKLSFVLAHVLVRASSFHRSLG